MAEQSCAYVVYLCVQMSEQISLINYLYRLLFMS